MKLILGLLVIGLLLTSCGGATMATVELGGERFSVEVVKSETSQARGLAGRRSLEVHEGMLFAYDSARDRTFWMKGMLIPIDLLWIRDGSIVGFEQAMIPDDGASRYPSPGPVDAVLEVAAGTVERLNLSIGDTVQTLDP